MCRVYNSAPLPFMGQKRRFVRDFREVLKRFDDVTTIVDLFGGSGLLAHVAKRERPEARVIYNDYDYFCKRIEHVATTNRILARLRELLRDVPEMKRLPPELRREVLAVIAGYEREGYVDYPTLGSSLLFSGLVANDYEELASHTMYNCVKKSDYKVDGYLDGLEIVHRDYREIFAEHKDDARTLFLIDPPYLSTEVGSYKCYWKLRDYLDVLSLLVGTKYIYFTSEKSQIIELCEWLTENPMRANPFAGAEMRTQLNNINYDRSFTDIMLVKA